MARNRSDYSNGTFLWHDTTLWRAAAELRPQMRLTKHVWDMIRFNEWGGSTTSADDFLKDMRRVLQADMSHPIILTPDGHLADGYHRVVKAVLENRRYIEYVKLKVMPPYDSGAPMALGKEH